MCVLNKCDKQVNCEFPVDRFFVIKGKVKLFEGGASPYALCWPRAYSHTKLLFHILAHSLIHSPKSSVIPRSLLCGFLSNEAVEAVVLRALAKYQDITKDGGQNDMPKQGTLYCGTCYTEI